MKIYDYNETYIQGNLKIQHFGLQINIIDCTNAGKRGKKCKRLSLYPNSARDNQILCDAVYNNEIKLEYVIDFDTAEKWAKQAKNCDFYIYEEKACEVLPLNFEKFSFYNDNFSVSVDLKGFTVSDLTDMHNEPRWISITGKTRKTSIKKLFLWCVKNEDKLGSMNFHDFTKTASDTCGVYGHYYCAMD